LFLESSNDYTRILRQTNIHCKASCETQGYVAGQYTYPTPAIATSEFLSRNTICESPILKCPTHVVCNSKHSRQISVQSAREANAQARAAHVAQVGDALNPSLGCFPRHTPTPKKMGAASKCRRHQPRSECPSS